MKAQSDELCGTDRIAVVDEKARTFTVDDHVIRLCREFCDG